MQSDSLYRLGMLVRHNVLLRLRDPGHLISYLVMPMVLMLAFKPLYTASIANSEAEVPPRSWRHWTIRIGHVGEATSV